MTGKRINATRKFIFRLSLGLIFIALCSNPTDLLAQPDKAKLQSRKAQLEKELSETSQELDETQKDKSANVRQVVLINRKINKREELINAIEQEVAGIDSQTSLLRDTINRIQQNLSDLKLEYSRLIYSTYKNKGDFDRLMFLFSSRDFAQAYRRLRYLQQYSEYRKKQFKIIEQTQRDLVLKKLDLENRKSSKLTLMHQQESERGSLANEKLEKDKKILNLTTQEKKLLVKLRENEAALNKLKDAIESLVAAEIKKANEEKARNILAKAEAEKRIKSKTENRHAENAKPVASVNKELNTSGVTSSLANSNSMSVNAEEVALTGSFAGNKGRLPSPVDQGSIISFFGEHAHPEFQNIKVKNNGIDINAPNGAKAKAVFEGEVSSVMFIANLNYVVILRHGDYLSVYSNLQEVDVKKGDKLKISQPIGTIAKANEESKAKLHFELWQGTTVLNPINLIVN